MCGIAGIFAGDRNAPVDGRLLTSMADTIAHRGPDGSGVRTAAGYGLAHRRLAIVDLSDGAQPMSDDRGEIWVTFNGEIYNFEVLRRELEERGAVFRTRCDTEVLVHGYREWGTALPERLRGMFAFAIVDERDGTLFAARDRVGKKPFYYAELPSGLAFGSEIKALLVHPEVRRDVDPVAVSQFFCLRYVPDPRSIFAGIKKLPPGSTLIARHGTAPVVRRYWNVEFEPVDSRSESELAEAVLDRLDDAVKVRLMGDVPLGAFLSGGVDSYAIVESMSRVSDAEVVACTMGFEDSALDERPLARQAARACGATLHEDAIAPDDMLEQSWFDGTFDEPFADSSAVPTYHVSRLARRHVTVALSGDGGDESFAGYRRYKFDVIENRTRSLLPGSLWAGLGAFYPKLDFLPRWIRFKRTFQNLARSPAEAYARSVSAVLPEEARTILRGELVDAAYDPLAPVRDAYEGVAAEDALSRAVGADFATWLPGDILTKVDRASMAVSLEVRAPFLDHELIEVAARIPSALKLKDGQTKGFLREALSRRLAGGALERPKQGFHVPLREWMGGRLGAALETALADERLGTVVDSAAVRRMLQQHRGGIRDHSEILWSTLVFHRFQERWL